MKIACIAINFIAFIINSHNAMNVGMPYGLRTVSLILAMVSGILVLVCGLAFLMENK